MAEDANVLLPPIFAPHSMFAAARRFAADPEFHVRVVEVSARTSVPRLGVAHVLAVDEAVGEVLR